MNKPQIELLEYVTEDGKNVFRTWLRKLKDSTARARIRVRLNRIRLGNFGDCKAVGEGVSELRIDYGPLDIGFTLVEVTLRLLFSFVVVRNISSQKTSNWPKNIGKIINGELYEKNNRII